MDSTSTGKRPQSLRQRQKMQTRATILETAKQMFERDGYDKTTMRKLAEAVGVGLGTIFNHFPDKESLLVECMLEDLVAESSHAWETMPADAPLRDQILHLAVVGYRAWLNRPALLRVLYREVFRDQGPGIERIRELDESSIKLVAELIESAKATGAVRADTDTILFARTAFSFYLTAVLSPIEERSPQQSDGQETSAAALERLTEETSRVLDMLFDGIRPRD